jgi:hypothetical protein
MTTAHRLSVRRAAALACATIVAALVAPCAAPAQHPGGPIYTRSRAAGNYHQHVGWTGHGAYGAYGYYQPWIAPPVVAGSWYSRPYPYHFDYYRGRWDGISSPSTPSADCPCASEPVDASWLEPAS